MQAVIKKYIFDKNGGSIPVCTERKATGLFVLTSFLCDNGEGTRKYTSEKKGPLSDTGLILTHCMQGTFSCLLLSSADFFFKINFFKKFF